MPVQEGVMIHRVLTYMLIYLIIFFIPPAYGMKEYYGNNECELIAKDYIKEHGGNYVFIQPLKENGAFEFGEYTGHFLNRAYSKDRGVYFIDYYSNTYFNNMVEINMWYKSMTGKDNIVYDFAVARPNYGIIWHY